MGERERGGGGETKRERGEERDVGEGVRDVGDESEGTYKREGGCENSQGVRAYISEKFSASAIFIFVFCHKI